MTFQRFYTSGPDEWAKPRPHLDASTRLYRHGPIQPMEEPSLTFRLIGLLTGMMRRI